MAANKAKAKTYFVFEMGKNPVMEIHLRTEDDVTRCIFSRYYDNTNNVHVQKIRLPEQRKSKKENENENEYDRDSRNIVYYTAEPYWTAKLKSWNWLNYFYQKKFKRIASYQGKFNVEVFDLGVLGKLYLVYNIFDEKIQLFNLL